MALITLAETNVATEIMKEVAGSRDLHGGHTSIHESLGIILEEWDEYKAEVALHNPRKGPDRDRRQQIRTELIHVAASCLRAIVDVIDKDKR